MRAKRRCMHGKRLRRSPMRNEPELIEYKPKGPKTGIAPTTGGLGLFIYTAKKAFEGYGKTNPDIIKGAKMMPGKI